MAQATIDTASQDPDFTRWMAEIARYEKDAKPWTERSKKIVKRYKDDRRGPADEKRTKYNILWSNLQVLMPAVYARNPVPEVERRFKDEDPVGREASEVLERCLDYCIKTQSFKGIMRAAVLDRFLPGRGVVFVRYVPHIVQAGQASTTLTDDVDPAPEHKLAGTPPATQAAPDEEVEDEECLLDYVHWKDFGHTVARTWEEVRGVWRISYLTRAECVQRFGETIGRAIPLAATDGKDKADTTVEGTLRKAMIYEIWDKTARTVTWLCKEYPNGCLDKKDDPLGLSGFFPCPRPLYATLDNESMIPTPDYVLYQDQADEIDILTARIASVARAIKVAGVYDASAQGVQRLLDEGVENKLIPVDSWAAFAEKGGLQGSIQFLPLKEIAEALLQLYETRDKVKQDLYEITGMSDIIRGANDPNETATATRIKGQFASIRLKDRQDEVAEFARDALRLMGEVMATHFGIETLARISGVDLPTEQQKQALQASLQPQAMPGQLPAPAPQPSADQLLMLQKPTWEQVSQLLQNDASRNFRIDIETDSTIGEDEQQQKEERLAMLKAVADFLREAIPAIQQNPQMGPLLGQMLMFTLRSFKAGRTLENVFEATMKQLEQASKQPAKPSAEETKAQAATQQVQAKAQADMQVNRDRIAAEAQQSAQELAQQKDLELYKAKLEQETAYREQDAQGQQAAEQLALEQRRDEARMAMEERLELRKQDVEVAARNADAQRQHELELAKLADAAQQREADRYKTDQDNATKITVAEISAKASLDAAATSAAASADQGEKQDAEPAAPQVDVESVVKTLFAELSESLTTEMAKPKLIERDAQGRAVSVNGRAIQRDTNNRITGF